MRIPPKTRSSEDIDQRDPKDGDGPGLGLKLAPSNNPKIVQIGQPRIANEIKETIVKRVRIQD